MNKFLDFLEELRDKYTREYLYTLDWESSSIDDLISKEDRYNLAKMIIDEKIKFKYMFIINNWFVGDSYSDAIKVYKEEIKMKPIQLMVAVALDILDGMICANTSEEWEAFIESSLDDGLLKDEYIMDDSSYAEYSKKQDDDEF